MNTLPHSHTFRAFRHIEECVGITLTNDYCDRLTNMVRKGRPIPLRR